MHIVLDLQACQSPESRRRGIGRYSLALAKALASHSQGHDITVLLNAGLSDSIEYLRGQFEGLLPQSQIVTWDALVPVAHLHDVNSFRRQASEVLRREVIRRIKPDVVHVASLIEGLADDVVSTIPSASVTYVTAATLYDLIPLAHQDVYLADPRVRRWYMEKIGYLRNADILLGISRFTCEEAEELLDIPQERLVDISGAADAMFQPLENAESFRRELMGRYNLDRPFVMYAGGFDARKNIASLIRAFALLPDTVRRKHQLAIVGGAPEPERLALQKVMVEVGLAADEVVFAGYVPDADLVKLYNLCELYAFPSLQEGFGLPALEAMSSGAIVIGSNTSSLPEVIGHESALFNPRDPQSIADKLTATLTDQALRDELRRHGYVQPLKFSWRESARRTINAFEAAFDRSAHRSKSSVSVQPASLGQEKAAYLPAPGSPLKKRGTDTVIVYADSDCEGSSAQRPLSRFMVELERFDRISIEVADHPYCAKTLPLAIHGAVDLLLRGKTFGNPLKILAATASNRELVHSLLYRSGGYPAISVAKEAGYSAEVLGGLVTADGMRSLGSSQIVDGGNVDSMDGGGRWRDHAQSIVAEIATFEGSEGASDQDWRRVATAISRDLIEPATRTPQWLVDISNLFVRDAGTGIQRVVRHVLDELIQSPPDGYRVEPVCLGDDGIFRYARSYCARRYFSGETLPPDDPVDFAQGDVYLGLDLVAHLIPAYIDCFRDLRNRGVQQYFVVYDLLPVLRPDCFEPHLLPLFRSWYEAVAEVADGVMCISQAVADEFRLWLDQARPERQRPIGIGYFHLGADLGGGNGCHPAPTTSEAELADLADRLTFLMVGTIEPRKGHAQVLGAFEQLWQQGREINLLIVGKPGWLNDDLLRHMRKHPERGHRFFWFEEASDDLLLEAYNRASALLMASEGEGFGLPLIEAAHHGLPLIVRDLPVFREIAEEHAHYFSGYESRELAASLDNWLHLYQLGRVPQSHEMRWITWQESAQQLVDGLLPPRWLHTWTSGSVWRHAVYDYRFRTDVGRLARGRMETRGTAGLLLYGLPLKLHAGQYRVRLLGGWIGHDGTASVEICSHEGTKTYYKVDLRKGYQASSACLVEIDLSLNADVSDLEIRVSVDAHANLWISEVELHPLTFAASSIAPALAESQSEE